MGGDGPSSLGAPNLTQSRIIREAHMPKHDIRMIIPSAFFKRPHRTYSITVRQPLHKAPPTVSLAHTRDSGSIINCLPYQRIVRRTSLGYIARGVPSLKVDCRQRVRILAHAHSGGAARTTGDRGMECAIDMQSHGNTPQGCKTSTVL